MNKMFKKHNGNLMNNDVAKNIYFVWLIFYVIYCIFFFTGIPVFIQPDKRCYKLKTVL